jgi:predicted lipoprotein with Yx(FWY)xxD motif
MRITKEEEETVMRSLLLLTAAAVTVVGLGLASSRAAEMATPAMTENTGIGKVLTDHKMMTLYTFDKDQPGKSNCNGTCANHWPPLMAPADAKPSGDWSVITRADGSKQWAYKGHPLYGWEKDTKPGDTTGDGVNKVWHAAHP